MAGGAVKKYVTDFSRGDRNLQPVAYPDPLPRGSAGLTDQ